MAEELINIDISVPNEVKNIMSAFKNDGYEIYLVGGCVRDSILKRDVNGWELCTNALPEEIIATCERGEFEYIPASFKNGIITIVCNNENYEVGTYRVEGKYSEGGHPEKVSFTNVLKRDLARRDFTINALAYNDEVKLVDYYGGLNDIKNRLIKCVGNAEKRFKEDSLRRLMAVRFASELDFDIEEETYRQLSLKADSLTQLSTERIKDELTKILLSNNPGHGIRTLANLGLLQYIIPEFTKCIGVDQRDKHHDVDVFEHSLRVVENVPQKLELRLSALLHDISKPDCLTIDVTGQGHFSEHEYKGAKQSESILKRLRFDNRTIDKVCTLVRYHMNIWDDINSSSIKKLITGVGIENLEDLFELQMADIKGYAPGYQNFDNVLALREKCNKIVLEKQPLAIKDLDINGKDLIELGYRPGREIKDKLSFLLELVLDNPELNTKKQLIERILILKSKE